MNSYVVRNRCGREVVRMIYGLATVELIEGLDYATNLARHGHATIVEPVQGFPGLVWVREEVYSFVEERGGAAVATFKRSGASGWYPAGNWRAFTPAAIEAAS